MSKICKSNPKHNLFQVLGQHFKCPEEHHDEQEVEDAKPKSVHHVAEIKVSDMKETIQYATNTVLYFNLTETAGCKLRRTSSARALATIPNAVLSKNITLCLKFFIGARERHERIKLFSFSTIHGKESSFFLHNRWVNLVIDSLHFLIE